MFRSPQVILFSEDVERTAEFYRRLGFAETFRVPASGEPIHVDLDWLCRLLIAWTADPDGHPIQLVQPFSSP